MERVYFDAEQIEDPGEDWRLYREAIAARGTALVTQVTANQATRYRCHHCGAGAFYVCGDSDRHCFTCKLHWFEVD